MPEYRLYNTAQAALKLGFINKKGEANSRAFLRWAASQGLRRPNGKHHLWWDFKAIEQHLDKPTENNHNLTDWDAIVRNRVASRGNIQSEISARA